MKLDGKKILVTGGTRGIGAALVSQLRAKGCRVLVVARDEAQLAVLERDGVDTLAADLSDPDMPRAIARWVAAEHPDCDVLVNNAAIMDHTFLTRDPLAKLNRIEQEIRINLTAPLQLSTAMLPVLSTRPQAAIVNVTSGLALTPLPNAAVYCATKAGVRMFTKALRHQIRAEQWDIQLSEVLMTRVDTTLSEGAPEGKYPPDRAAADLIRGVEAGRREIFIEKVALLHRIWRLSPALADRIIGRHVGATA
ncbi:SDR family oxidoreductase [Celeribacter sp.]|uniref:SDR family oxidoreductase n=1 Tax=Celeribacter sp. TaxID=1890673 RepID=UPI003A8D211C